MQDVVRFVSKSERKQAMQWLEENGYKVPQLVKDNVDFGYVIIEKGLVYTPSVTCLAAAKPTVITWAQWLHLKESGNAP